MYLILNKAGIMFLIVLAPNTVPEIKKCLTDIY